MTTYKARWKRVIFPLFLIHLAACSQQHSAWSSSSINTPYSEYNSSRICYKEANAEVEFLKTQDVIYGNLNVRSLPIPALPEDAASAKIQVSINGETTTLLAHRNEGGQRLNLPETATLKILSSLQKGSEVTLKAGRYTLSLPSNFREIHSFVTEG